MTNPTVSTLLDLQRHYLEVRQHTLSTAGMRLCDAIRAEARYVRGEALEMCDAAEELLTVPGAEYNLTYRTHLRHELADVVLAAVTMADLFGWHIEDCIAEKTEADRGRG